MGIMNRIGLSRVNRMEMTLIINYRGVFDNPTVDAFCKLLDMEVEDFIWEISDSTAGKIRDTVLERITNGTRKPNNSVRGSVRVRRKGTDRSISVK